MPILHMSEPKSISYDIARSEKYPLVKDAHCCPDLIGPASVGFNAGHLWDVDPRDLENSSRALMQGRELARQYHEGLKEYLPQVFGASWLAQTAPVVGVRESRRIIGDYTFTAEDYFARRSFDDEIGRNCYFLDVHLNKAQNEQVLDGKANGEENWEPYKAGESHGIPYRSLVVAGADNLLAAGRIISCDHRTQGSLRVMPVCFVTGQAAGTAAALIPKGAALRDLDISLLRERLRKDGAYLPQTGVR
jgi:hypothetical protein